MLIPESRLKLKYRSTIHARLHLLCLAEISRKLSRLLLRAARSMSSSIITDIITCCCLSVHTMQCKVVVVVDEHMYVHNITCWGQCGFISFLLIIMCISLIERLYILFHKTVFVCLATYIKIKDEIDHIGANNMELTAPLVVQLINSLFVHKIYL